MHLVHDSPGQEFRKFMLTLPRRTPSQCREVISRPFRSRDIKQGK